MWELVSKEWKTLKKEGEGRERKERERQSEERGRGARERRRGKGEGEGVGASKPVSTLLKFFLSSKFMILEETSIYNYV